MGDQLGRRWGETSEKKSCNVHEVKIKLLNNWQKGKNLTAETDCCCIELI